MKKIKLLLPLIAISPIAISTIALASCSQAKVIDTTVVEFSADKAFNLSLLDNEKHWSGEGTESVDWKLEYKKADGTWEIWKDGSTVVPSIQKGSKYNIYLRGTGINTFSDISDPQSVLTTTFVFNPVDEGVLNVDCNGDIRTLLNYSDFDKAKMNDCCFWTLFKDNTHLITPPQLPLEVVSESCYREMFAGCTSLVLPAGYCLPATKHWENGQIVDGLAKDCYKEMFETCYGITTIPTNLLPAKKLNENCYQSMFDGCLNLLAIPAGLLPAEELEVGCYSKMFQACKTIKSLPDRLLPAQELVEDCYEGMFSTCDELTNIPVTLLPAERLAPRCYMDMFCGCHNLKQIPADLLPATLMYDECYYGMFSNTGLESLPAGLLPAAKADESGNIVGELAPQCYESMFQDCGKLTTLKAGVLLAVEFQPACCFSMFRGSEIETIEDGFFQPSATLAITCFRNMFWECSSLKTIPENLLPYTDIVDGCYAGMFADCTSLTNALLLPATELQIGCYSNMFKNCTSLKVREDGTGTKIFTCPSTIPKDAVFDMFVIDDEHSGGGEFKETPTAGHTYNWYE